jgi:hypothetical protein
VQPEFLRGLLNFMKAGLIGALAIRPIADDGFKAGLSQLFNISSCDLRAYAKVRGNSVDVHGCVLFCLQMKA